MNPELEVLIRLQHLVDQRSELETRLQSLPQRLAEAENVLEQRQLQLEQTREGFEQEARQRRQLEAELADAESRVQRWKEQLMEVKSNTEYRALTDEIGHEQTRIGGLEEQILLHMDQTEGRESALAEVEKQLGEAERVLQQSRTENQRESESLTQQRDRLEVDVADVRGKVPKRLLALYERLAGQRGAAVVPIVEDACGACRVRIRPQVLGQLRETEQIQQCESCQRILYWSDTRDTP